MAGTDLRRNAFQSVSFNKNGSKKGDVFTDIAFFIFSLAYPMPKWYCGSMKIKKNLVVLDLESTGIWIEKDKIIEIALLKYTPEGARETFTSRINPDMVIPAVVTTLTGISNQDVQNAPRFRDIADKILKFIGPSDIAGFNVERFDLPLLKREFEEAGLRFEWEDRIIYDAQKVFHLNEKRDLSAAFQFYCGKELTGAHSAMADSQAVYDILEKQVEEYGKGDSDLTVLLQFEYESLFDFYDDERKFCWWNGKLYCMFGKYARKIPLEDIVKSDPGYLKWMLSKDFSDSIKSIVRAALNGDIPTKS